MDVRKRQPIGIELVKRGIVKESDIDNALQEQRRDPDKKLGEILNDMQVCDSYTLIQTIGDILGVKGILLTESLIKIDVLEYISLEVAKRNKVIPFEVDNGRNIETIRLLMLNKGLILDPYITFGSVIDRILKGLGGTAEKDMTRIGQDDNITEIVDSIIKTAMEKRASDIHIEPQKDEIRIRYRIDGELFTATSLPKEKQVQIIGRLKAISNMHQEKQESQDGRILLYDDYNIRVSSQKNVYGEKFVLRLLKKNTNIKNIFDLGYPGTEKELNKSINKRNSITIIAAPTGEGKTTTLYSFMDYLNNPEINITTIEDPVEIRIDGLNQIEIEAKLTFSEALRTVLRQDPDIILVGEVRDKETAEIAMQAGQTGHYVLSTIHTIDAVEVITRLRKMGIPDYDIASTLATSISQRLVRKLCPKCRREREFTEEEKRLMESIGKRYNEEFDFSNLKTFDAIGCDYCNNTGYYERTGIFEILDIDDEIKEMIMNGASSIEIKKYAIQQKYKPLCVDGIRKVLAGETNLEELNRKILLF